jgi:hypothetical protein
VLELGNHYGWLGDDVQEIWDAITTENATRDVRLACLGKLLVSSSDPAKVSVPPLPGQIGALPGADYVAVINLPPVFAAHDLVSGVSTVPDMDDSQDPKAPTGDTSGSSPD